MFDDIWKNKTQTINKKLDDKVNAQTVVVDDDGSIVLNDARVGYSLNFEWEYDNQHQLIQTYRVVSELPEVDYAVEDIANEAITFDSESPVDLDLGETEFSENIKNKIIEEYDNIKQMMDFNNTGFDQFKQWYIDGRCAYQKILDTNKPKNGIIAIKKIDSMKIKKVKNVEKNQDDTIKSIKNYYVYDETLGMKEKDKNKAYHKNVIEFPEESIVYVDSGLYCPITGYAKSYLHKALKPANQLSMLEDSTVVYRVARSSEKRVFYVDTGGLPKTKAEQYMRSIMNNHKSKFQYDVSTGSVKGQKHTMTMFEDIWLPRNGSKGTEVSTIQGGQNLGEVEDVEYFQRKLYKSLNVPLSRLDPNSSMSFGRSSEITRDEIKFNKFIQRLRNRFNAVFIELLRSQLVLKGIITEKEFSSNEQHIHFIYSSDLYLSEQHTSEMTRERVDLLNQMNGLVGKYYSHSYIRREILRQSDQDIKTIDEQIIKEKNMPQYKDDEEDVDVEFGR